MTKRILNRSRLTIPYQPTTVLTTSVRTLVLNVEHLEERLVPYSQPVHEWISMQGYEFFAKQFGETNMKAYVGSLGGAANSFIGGAFDEDESGQNPWGEGSTTGNANSPSLRHFWAHDGNFDRTFDDGLFDYDSAPNRAIKYFTGGYGLTGELDTGNLLGFNPWGGGQNAVVGEGATARYEAGDKTTAFYWLGHVAHLLQDMTVPAHAHADPHLDAAGIQADPDPYHDWVDGRPFSNRLSEVGTILRLSHFRDLDSSRWLRYGLKPTDDIYQIRSATDVLPSSVNGTIYQLFLETAQVSETYDTLDYVGRGSPGTRSLVNPFLPGGPQYSPGAVYASFSNTDLADEARDLVPRAIKGSAELIRIFYSTVDTTKPTIELAGLCPPDLGGTEAQTDTNITLTAVASDQSSGDSGIGKDLFGIEVADLTAGGGWKPVRANSDGSAETLHGDFFSDGASYSNRFADQHGAKATTTFTGVVGHTYAFRATAQDGAGNSGVSPVYYVQIISPDQTPHGCVCTDVSSPSPVNVSLGGLTLNPGDRIDLEAILTTTDPNESGEGEPLHITSSGGFSLTISNYSNRQAVSFTASQVGETIQAYIEGQDGDETGTVCVTVNQAPGSFNQSTKNAYTNLSNDLNQQVIRSLTVAQLADPSTGALTLDNSAGAVTATVTVPADPAAAVAAVAAAGFRLEAAFLARASDAFNRMTFRVSDADFATVAAPVVVPFTLTAAGGPQPVIDAFNALFQNEASAAATAEALAVSLERATAAEVFGDTAARDQQTAATHQYALQLAALLDAQLALRAGVQAALTAAGFTVQADAGAIYDYESVVADRGLPNVTVRALLLGGASGAVVDNATRRTLAQNNSISAGGLPEALTAPRTNIAIRAAIRAIRAWDAGTPLTVYGVGADIGGGPQVTVYPAAPTTDGLHSYFAFDPSFRGGVRVASADLNTDGVADQVVATGPGQVVTVRVLDGKTGNELFTTQPFENNFTGGAFVSAGDLTGDGIPDFVISPDVGGGPRVLIYDGNGFGVVANFFGIDEPAFRGGARTAIADINGDGVGDLIVSAGFGGGPRVTIWDGASITAGKPAQLANFFIFDSDFRNGVFVTAGDLDADGFADVIAGAGPGGLSRVFALSGRDLLDEKVTPLADFVAGGTARQGGVRVAVADLDGDDRADIVTAAGSDSRIITYVGRSLSPDGMPAEAQGFEAIPGFNGGTFVG